MNVAVIRRKLYDYIRDAEDRKVRAIFTLVENEIEIEQDVWDDHFVKEMVRRREDYKTGKARGYTWEEVQKMAREGSNSIKVQVIFHEEAEVEYRESFIWYEERVKGLGDRFQQAGD